MSCADTTSTVTHLSAVMAGAPTIAGVLLAAPLVAAPDAMPGVTIPGVPTMGHPDDMAPMPGMAIQN